MMMKLRRTHIPEKILKSRNKRIAQEKLMQAVREILEKDSIRDQVIKERLANTVEANSNNFDFDLLETDRIYHISDIKKICIQYRLRFLDSNYFKGKLPYEAIIKIKELENKHQLDLQGFKIMAPAKLFKLENADDPLLFAPIGNDYYYLIHSWGRDLHPLRKFLMWPFREVENFIMFVAVISLLFTFLVPDGLFSPKMTTSEFIMTFFFIFKGAAGMAIFYGFKKGKNFSTAIWDSKYYNA